MIEAAGDFFQPLDGRQQRQDGAQFVELEVVFLGQIHQGGDGAEAERAEGKKDERGVQAGPAVDELRARAGGGSRDGIRAKTPMPKSTGEANAPRKRRRDHAPKTR